MIVRVRSPSGEFDQRSGRTSSGGWTHAASPSPRKRVTRTCASSADRRPRAAVTRSRIQWDEVVVPIETTSSHNPSGSASKCSVRRGRRRDSLKYPQPAMSKATITAATGASAWIHSRVSLSAAISELSRPSRTRAPKRQRLHLGGAAHRGQRAPRESRPVGQSAGQTMPHTAVESGRERYQVGLRKRYLACGASGPRRVGSRRRRFRRPSRRRRCAGSCPRECPRR